MKYHSYFHSCLFQVKKKSVGYIWSLKYTKISHIYIYIYIYIYNMGFICHVDLYQKKKVWLFEVPVFFFQSLLVYQVEFYKSFDFE